MRLKTVHLYSILMGLKRGVVPQTIYESVDYPGVPGVNYYFTSLKARNKNVLIEYLKKTYGGDLLRESLVIQKFATLEVQNPSNIIPLSQEEYDYLFNNKDGDKPMPYAKKIAGADNDG